MISLNNKKEEITVVGINENQVPKFVNSEDGKATFISAEAKIYVVLKEKTNDRRNQLVKAMTNLVKEHKLSFNVDLDSFIKLAPELKPEVVFNILFETIDFNTFKVFSLKEQDTKAEKLKESNYNFITKHDLKQVWTNALIKAEYTNFARVLQDTPPNIGTSVYFAKKIETEAKKIAGVNVKIIGLSEAKKLGMGLFLGVNAGSHIEPQAVVLEYVSDAKLPKTALVGKGITFDSGGYNLKPSNFMEGMKFDMSGAAIMLSTVLALAKAKVKANVVAVGMFTDNRIGGTATLPESVLTSMNGKTVEINNTDAEGRLVLADGITYMVREKKADRIIEASTLTGAIQIALGHWFTGAFTSNDDLYEDVLKATNYTGERIWRLPVIAEHLEKMQESAIADLTNSEKGREAGSSTAAAFLNVFAESKPYLHLDIAATADNGKRGTGVMVKTLFELLNK